MLIQTLGAPFQGHSNIFSWQNYVCRSRLWKMAGAPGLHYDSGDLSVEDYKDDDDGLALVEQPEEVPPPADEEERQEEDHEPGKKLDPEEDIDLAPPALVNLVSSRQV